MAMQHPTRPLLALALLCAVLHWLPASGQVPSVVWPLSGQGLWPDSLGKVVVTVDAHLDRLLEINQNAQSWRAVHRMHLSWIDPRAQSSVQTATDAWYNASSPFGSCSMPCDASMSYEAGCCDSIWLPHIDLPNLVEFNFQVTPPRWRIWVEPVVLSNGTSSSKVHWTVRLDGTWFSPFDFRAWPLEHQHLVLEMQPSPVLANKLQLVLGSLSQLSNTPHTKGVDLAGWWIKKVTPRMYDTSACFRRSGSLFWVFGADNTSSSGSSSSSRLQPRSLGPSDLTTLLTNTTVVTTVQEGACGNIGNAEGISQYGAYILVIDSMVVRDKTFYVLIFIFPLIIVTLMVFVIYAMERQNLEARMGVVVTLVLALSALQFMYDFPPASYLNVVQQLTLTSYVLFGLIAVECIITSSIARIHERKRAYEATLIAAGIKSLRPSVDLNRCPASNTDSFADNLSEDRGSRASPASGLFFGSQPRGSDSGLFKPAVPPPAARRNAFGDCEAPALPAIPEADSRPASSMPRASDHFSAPVWTAEGPEGPSATTRQAQLIRVQGQAGGGGQPIAEAMEWPAWPRMFAQCSCEGSEMRTGSMQQPSPGEPYAPAPQPGRLRQSMGRARSSAQQLWTSVNVKTRALHSKMSMDEAFAQLLARRVDTICSWVLLVSYIIAIAVVLGVSSSVGDHKLMMAGESAPGNM